MSSVTTATGVGVSALAAAGGCFLASMLLGGSDDDDDDSLISRYDANEDGKLSANEVRAAKSDFKAGRLSSKDFEALTGSPDTMLLLLAGLAAAVVLVFLLCYWRRIKANIEGVFAAKPKLATPQSAAPPADLPALPTPPGADDTKGDNFYLTISGMSARDLKDLMHFTTDKPYVAIKSSSGLTVTSSTDITGSSNDPSWKETIIIAPWFKGDDLEISVLSRGLFNSKRQGTGSIPSSRFYPNAFSGEIDIIGERLTGKNPSTYAKLQLDITAHRLPAGWEAALCPKTAHSYYFNREKTLIQWKLPTQ